MGSAGAGGHVVGIGQARRAAAQQLGDLVLTEASQCQIKAQRLQVAKLDTEKLIVPAGIKSQLIVGQDVGALRVSLRPASSITGICAMPNLRAASTHPWPAMMPLSPSTSKGSVQPNSTIAATFAFECV